MPKHDIRLQRNAEVPVGKIDLVIPVDIDGELRGRLENSTHPVDWRPRNARAPKTLAWGKFAELMEQHGR